MDITTIIEPVRNQQNIFVDYGFRQGQDKILQVLKQQNEEYTKSFVEAGIADSKEIIHDLIQKTKPYTIPENYIFFLEFYGALWIETDDYYFSTLGIGPMVEQFYSSINSDEAFHESGQYGILKLGSLSFRSGKYKFQYLDFFLDLAGQTQRDSVISVGPWEEETVTASTVVKNLSSYPKVWQKCADSFEEWLQLVVKTNGGFGYM